MKTEDKVISLRHFGIGHHLPSLRNWQSCSVEEIGQHSTLQRASLSVRLAFSVPPWMTLWQQVRNH